MHCKEGKIRRSSEYILPRIMRLVCYVSLPLILLMFLTIGASFVVTGGISTNVNNADSIGVVLASFSLPMILALAVVPLVFKLGVEGVSHKSLGLSLPRGRWSIIACIAMAVGSAVIAVMMSGSEALQVSAWTVWIHFFFVAVAEDIMLRCVVMDELRGLISNKWLLCLANGVIFAFVYHSNSDFVSNILFRVPLGFILSVIRLKSDNVYTAIGFHWIYNMFVTII